MKTFHFHELGSLGEWGPVVTDMTLWLSVVAHAIQDAGDFSRDLGKINVSEDIDLIAKF